MDLTIRPLDVLKAANPHHRDVTHGSGMHRDITHGSGMHRDITHGSGMQLDNVYFNV